MPNMTLLVSNSHSNVNSEMKLTSIIDVFQDIEGIHLSNINNFTDYFKANNMGIYLMYRQVDIIKKPKFAQKIILSTHPYNTNSISGYRHIYIKDEDGNDLVKSISFGAFVNLKTARPVRIPREIVKSVKDGTPDDSMEHLPRKIDYDSSKGKIVRKIKIEQSHIDRYGHLNNAYYVEFAVNVIKDINKYDRIRAEYIKPFLIDETAVIVLNNQSDDKVVIELKDVNDNISAIIEFSIR